MKFSCFTASKKRIFHVSPVQISQILSELQNGRYALFWKNYLALMESF